MAKRKRLTDAEATVALDYFENAGVPNSEQTQWKPGQSGNPSGKPKAPDENLPLTEMLALVLRGGKGNKAMAQHLINLARGNYDGVPYTVQLSATQYIYDRIEGKPRQSMAATINEEPPIVRLLRGLVDDKSALEGRQPRSQLTRGDVDAVTSAQVPSQPSG